MNHKKISMALAMALFVAACTSRPIMNVTDTPVVTTGDKPIAADQVRNAIISGGNGLGWVMTPVSPGLVSGTLKLRNHLAVVDVRYTAKTFSIAYKDSTNLDYQNGQIHKNYNGWIENLDREIRNELLRI